MRDGRGGRDRPLHRVVHAAARVGADAGVQHDAGAGIPGLFLAADHQVAPARGGAPVDPAYVVALPVLPDQHVVLADHADPVRPSLAGVARPAGRRGSWAGAPPAA